MNVTYDPQSMKSSAETISNDALNLNHALNAIYRSVEEMGKIWHGGNYNELVQNFNAMRGGLDTVVRNLINIIPNNIKDITNNYARALNVPMIQVEIQSPQPIMELATVGGLPTFDSTQVSQRRDEIATNFNASEDILSDIKNKCNSINWQSSSAAETYKRNVSSLLDKTSSSFEDIRKQLTQVLNVRISDAIAAENANTQ